VFFGNIGGRSSIISFVIALIISISITPLIRILAIKIKAVDIPKDSRRMHNEPMPLLGGLAFIIAFVVTILINIIGNKLGYIRNFNNFKNFDPLELVGFFAGILILCVGGIIDDKFKISARFKFIFQLAAAAAVVLSGTKISAFTNPFSYDSAVIVVPTWLAIIFSIVWVVGLTNAMNFLDGLDGLAAGVSAIASLSLFLIVILTSIGSSEIALFTAVLAGSVLGFLPYNFNPAKIFMGEAGSSFLGYVLAVISINGVLKVYTAFSLAIPIIVLAIPLFDTAFAIIMRTLS